MRRFKAFSGNTQLILLIVIALIGGLWYLYSNRIFPFDDLGRPRADISHEIFSACLDSDRRWLRAIVSVQNIGTGRFKIGNNDHYVSQVAPAGDYSLPERASTGAFRWPLLAHSPPGATDDTTKPHRDHASSDDFSIRPATQRVLEPGESHRQYQDFVIPPAARVVEVSSAFWNASKSTSRKAVSWEAKTIYDVASTSCAP